MHENRIVVLPVNNHGCGALASWAVRHITVCLDMCSGQSSIGLTVSEALSKNLTPATLIVEIMDNHWTESRP